MKQMKFFIFIFFTITLYNCGNKAETNSIEKNTQIVDTDLTLKGKDLFEGKGTCIACHKPTSKVIGPSIKEIATIYKKSNGNIIAFLKEESEPIVDKNQYEVMKTNFSITKKMSEEELKALEAYMLSFAD